VLVLKSILGRSPKVKESIERPLQVGDLVGRCSVGLCIRVQDTITAYGYVSVTVFVLALSSE
jgi:hypothetical protein